MTPEQAGSWGGLVERFGLPLVLCVILGWVIFKIDRRNERLHERMLALSQETSRTVTDFTQAFDRLRETIESWRGGRRG